MGDLFEQRALEVGYVDLAAGGDVEGGAAGAGEVGVRDDAGGGEGGVVGGDG